MPVDIKTLEAEIATEVTDAKAAIAALHAEISTLQASVGNVSDADAAAIRSSLADLKATYSPAPPPSPQPAPSPPTN